jgi:rubrerythrin
MNQKLLAIATIISINLFNCISNPIIWSYSIVIEYRNNGRSPALFKEDLMTSALNVPQIKTLANLESAFAGESMAHIKYRYFAKLARAVGDEDTARTFEETADQEVQHAFGHLDLLYPKDEITPAKALQIAIDGETYEYTEMYPTFRKTAEAEGNALALKEIDEQISESREHAERFAATLAKAQKRFAALAKVEERHANHYKAQLAKVAAL